MVGSAVSTVSVSVVVVSSNVTVSVMIVSGALEDALGWTAEECVTVWRMERGRTGTVSVSVRVTPSIVSVKVFVTSRAGRAATKEGQKAICFSVTQGRTRKRRERLPPTARAATRAFRTNCILR